jgi:hypothetical protein
MTWYVAIPKINGRFEFVEFVDKLRIRGFADRVFYYDGGWADDILEVTLSHLKFEHRDDAVAYILAFGGEILTTIPVRIVHPGG